MSEEEYDALDIPDITEDDFSQIDQLSSTYFNSQAGPQVIVQLEPTQSLPINNLPPIRHRPPLQEYRPNQVLSVSDLVSPAWCEVQFDYGLRQQRHKPLDKRPQSFTSGSGKQISVQKKVAEKNDIVTKNGQTVHKKLEEELSYEKIQVQITKEEERWGLRMLNLITGLKGLILDGYTRELPIFGIVHGQIVVGIIDEVRRHMHTNSKAGASSLGRQMQRSDTSEKHAYLLHLIDTKTRRSDSLPPPEDTLTARLQLMLYYRLLTDLISEQPQFSFAKFWNQLGVDSAAIFSIQFLVQAGLITEWDQSRTACLNDLARLLREVVEELHVIGVDQELEVVYRLQPSKTKSLKRVKKKTSTSIPLLGLNQEERDLAMAIEASLKKQNGASQSTSSRGPEALDPKLGISGGSEGLTDNGELVATDKTQSIEGEQTSPSVYADDTRTGVNDSGVDITSDEEKFRIIGSKIFAYQDSFLDDHITSILQWWNGERKPIGVPIDLSRRCFTCEYCADCEWREEKAMELMKSAQERRNGKESGE
ncbi:hypothetical protein AMATHDRAFT_46408 [Amanita thiersii Skay4041]|uniref:Exonuclease V n=1 Tax=Amanita thiersii Skay4041 TaxID=703135 RepID=A0A2A9NWW7_9AGAR|nr:hypothetical protein AMATHDRAFT_46408 [Amanita thiersii Skay4041]